MLLLVYMSNEDEEYEKKGNARHTESGKTFEDVREEADRGNTIQPNPISFHPKRVYIYTKPFTYKIYHMDTMEEFEKVKREYGDEE